MTDQTPPAETRFAWSDALAAELRRVGKLVELDPGQCLFRKGDAADAVYVLVDGTLEVVDQRGGGEERPVRPVEPGGYVGRSALLPGGTRTATVRARQTSRLVRVSREDLPALEASHRGIRHLLAELARRRMPSLRLATFPMFEGFGPELLAELERCFEWMIVPGGSCLFRKGDPPDALYLVVHGRLRVLLDDAGGTGRSGEVGPGEVVGEMALVTGEHRSSDVWALRDSELLKLGREDFDRILARHPAMYRPLLRAVVSRLRHDRAADHGSWSRDRTLALVPLGRRAVEAELVGALTAALRRYGLVLHLNRERFDAVHGAGAADLHQRDRRFIDSSEWLNRQEENHACVLYEADPEPSEWTLKCLRQADHLLLVGHAEELAEVGPNANLVDREGTSGASRPTSLLLLHRRRDRELEGTAAWLDRFRLSSHHHLALDEPKTADRVGRILAGRSVGLVLGGGGARGFAHIGVLRALEERGIPVDHVGGASTGAVIGSLWAAGSSVDEIVDLNEAAFVRSGLHRAFTFPLVSILAGEVPARHLDARFGSRRIEDLWTDFFCVSANLTRAETRVHRRGVIADAVLASVAMPGLFPPVFEEGDVLVDGGLANNLPVDVMRERCRGTVIASDPSPGIPLVADRTLVRCPPALRLVADRLLRRRRFKDLPRLGDIVRRTVEYGSIVHKNRLRRQATLYLTPPVVDIALLDGVRIREITAIGYEYAMRELEGFELG